MLVSVQSIPLDVPRFTYLPHLMYPLRFFIFYLVLFSMSVFSTAIFRTIASFARDETVSQVWVMEAAVWSE